MTDISDVKRRASAGDIKAMTALGAHFAEANDLKAARKWWRKAGDLGGTDAMYNLGTVFEQDGDLRRAREWYAKAADAGEAAAIRALAVMAQFEEGDDETARDLYEQAAKLGDGLAMNNLGLLLYHGGDTKRYRNLLRDAATAGYSEALFNLGVLAKDAGDLEDAKEWLQRAADKGVVNAFWGLGVIAKTEGALGAARRYADAAADQGSVAGMELVAELYQNGGELIRARAWYTKAAEHGSASALFQLGLLDQESEDLQGARKWYEKAVEGGHENAHSNLGFVLEGLGDREGARRCFGVAAELGLPEGFVGLGVLAHKDGDDVVAREQYRRAADLGNAPAMTNLGLIAQAEGDLKAAEDWWQKGAALGNVASLFQLGLLEQRDQVAADQEPLKTRAEGGDAEAMFEFALGAFQLNDVVVAQEWFSRAADALEADGELRVAGIAASNAAACADQQGDLLTARRWLERAVDLGNSQAEALLERIDAEAPEVLQADVDSRIAEGDKADLVSLIETTGRVAALSSEQQVSLAKHRSVDVPRALAKHGPELSPEAVRVLAKSRIFTARRNLAKSGGAGLPEDVLELLAADEDEVVCKIIAAVWSPDPKKIPADVKSRKTKNAERIEKITLAKSLDQVEVETIIKAAKKDEVLALIGNPSLLVQCSDEQQVRIAQHRSVEVPRALALHAAMLCPEAVRTIAESRIYTARRALVRFAGSTLPLDVRILLGNDDDEIVRKLISDLGDEHTARADVSTALSGDRREIEKAAKQGDVGAMAALGLDAWDAGDLKSAKAWLANAAKAGDRPSMLDLESIAIDEGDQASARAWLEQAAKSGYAPAARRWYETVSREKLNTIRSQKHPVKTVEQPGTLDRNSGSIKTPSGRLAIASLEGAVNPEERIIVKVRQSPKGTVTKFVVHQIMGSGDADSWTVAAYLVALEGYSLESNEGPLKLTPIGDVDTDTATLVVLDPDCDLSGIDQADLFEAGVYGQLHEFGLDGRLEILTGEADGTYAVYGVGSKPYAQLLIPMTVDPLALKNFLFSAEQAASESELDYWFRDWTKYAQLQGDRYLKCYVRALEGDWPISEDAAARGITDDEYEDIVDVLARVGHPVALRESGKLALANNDDLGEAKRVWKKAAALGDSEAKRLLIEHKHDQARPNLASGGPARPNRREQDGQRGDPPEVVTGPSDLDILRIDAGDGDLKAAARLFDTALRSGNIEASEKWSSVIDAALAELDNLDFADELDRNLALLTSRCPGIQARAWMTTKDARPFVNSFIEMTVSISNGHTEGVPKPLLEAISSNRYWRAFIVFNALEDHVLPTGVRLGSITDRSAPYLGDDFAVLEEHWSWD